MTAAGFKILVADRLDEDGIRLLQATPGVEVVVRKDLPAAEFPAAAADVDAILVRSAAKVTAAVLQAAARLRVIGRAGIGVDNVDVPAATERGVLVMNVPDANADTTAEHTIALLCALARGLPQADRSVRAGRWERSKFLGTELTGKVLGVIGGGNIGRRVAARGRGLGMQVVVYDPFLPPDGLADLHVEVVPLDDLVARADFVTLHVPLLDATRNLIDAALIARMKDGVRIVNCARGGIVDEVALEAALRSGKVAGAALDVFAVEPPPQDHPLFALDNVVLTPHLGASTREAQTRASIDICRQVLAYLADGEVKNAVNLPRVDPATRVELEPWIDLARRLGAFLAGILQGPCDDLEVSYRGDLAGLDTGMVTRALVAGFLTPALDAPVNLVNALPRAQARGLTVEERRVARIRDFASMLTARARCGDVVTAVSGTLFGHRQPRIVKIDDFLIEAIPEGTILFVRNQDRPGVVGRIGSLLGATGVNIQGMHLAPPHEPGGHALALITVDPGVPDSLLQALRALPEVHRAELVRLDPREPS